MSDSTGNGSKNGAARDSVDDARSTIARQHLLDLIAHHEAAAREHAHVVTALQTTLQVLDGLDVVQAAIARATGVPAFPAAPPETADAPVQRRPRTRAPAVPFVSDAQKRREKTASFLARFSHDEPVTLPPADRKRVGVLIAHGYLVKRGEGYVLGKKEFEV